MRERSMSISKILMVRITIPTVSHLIVDKENEFLFEQLKKSQEITELLQSIVAKLMGLEVSVKVSLNPNARLDDGKKGLSVAQEIFDVEDLN